MSQLVDEDARVGVALGAYSSGSGVRSALRQEREFRVVALRDQARVDDCLHVSGTESKIVRWLEVRLIVK